MRVLKAFNDNLTAKRTFSIAHSVPLQAKPSQKKFLPLCQPRTPVCRKTSTFLFQSEALGCPGISGAEFVSGWILKKAMNIARGIPESEGRQYNRIKSFVNWSKSKPKINAPMAPAIRPRAQQLVLASSIGNGGRSSAGIFWYWSMNEFIAPESQGVH